MVDLNSPANQTTFGKLVGASQQAISKQVEKGVLIPGQTHAEWLKVYVSHLREEAAGRGGDHQAQLTMARIEESRENAAEKKQRRLTAAQALLVRDEVEAAILELPRYIQSSVLSAGDTIIEAIESRYSIELDDEIVTKPLRSALGHAANRVVEFEAALSGDQ